MPDRISDAEGLLDDTGALKDYLDLIKEHDATRPLAIASYLPLYGNDLRETVQQYEDADVYSNMESADAFVRKRGICGRLANWRGDFWAGGCSVHHPHPVVREAYKRFSEKIKLPLLAQQCMRDLSSMCNACLIWRKNSENGEIEYVRFYNPSQTRIDRIRDNLWIIPDADFKGDVQKATKDELDAFMERRNGSSLIKWIDAIRSPGKYAGWNFKYYQTGMIPLNNEDDEYWLLFHSDGDTNQYKYSPVEMLRIFGDIELLQLLVDGDWATAFRTKNMLEIIRLGESIASGPLAGSKKNWASEKDLQNIRDEHQKPGKVQTIYGNHTLQVEYTFPDPKVYAPEKYDAVIDRICWYFGIGPYAMLGANRRGGSYSMAVWNVQTIRAEAKLKRKIVSSMFTDFLTHKTIVPVVFRGLGPIGVHDFIGEIDRGRILKSAVEFENLDALTGQAVQYSTDGFINTKEYPIAHVMSDINTIVLQDELPEDARPEDVRLYLNPNMMLSLYGPPEMAFDARSLKEDRQALAELQAAIKQGPLSNLAFLRELGFRIDEEMSQKAREWEHRANLIPIHEANQGLLENVTYGMGKLFEMDGDESEDGQREGAPGEPGRPETREETEEDTSVTPRPSQA